MVWSLEFWVSNYGFRVPSLEFRVSGFEFRGWGSGVTMWKLQQENQSLKKTWKYGTNIVFSMILELEKIYGNSGTKGWRQTCSEGRCDSRSDTAD